MTHPIETPPVASSPRVGIIVSKYDSQYYGQILDSTTQQLERDGYSVIIRSTDASSLGVKDVWESLIRSDCQGVILNSQDMSEEALLEMTSAYPNSVLINRYIDKIPHQCVRLDNAAGARLAVEHLVEMGHRNIAMITGPVGYSEVLDRTSGFREEMKKHHLTVSEALIESADFTSEGGALAFRRLLKSDSPFSAVFIQSDNMAAGVLDVCREEEISTPADISIVGFDDIFTARITTPKLTTIRQPVTDAGIRAANTLHALISNTSQNAGLQPTFDELKPKLIVRDSVHDQRLTSESTRPNRRFTPRENECLQWIALGRSSIEISSILSISEDTVNFHTRNVIRKLDARNRTHAVAIAFTHGLVSLENERMQHKTELAE